MFLSILSAKKVTTELYHFLFQFSSVSHVQLFVIPWTAARQASLSIANSQSPPKPMSIEPVMPSNHLTLCHPLLLLPSIFPSIRDFSNESALRIRCPKYWIFRFNISPTKEHPGLLSFRMDWLDLLAVQRTLKSLLQHHSSKASILQCSTFLIVQLSDLYMTTGKTIALTRQTFVDKVMSLLFNMLSRLVIKDHHVSYSFPWRFYIIVSWKMWNAICSLIHVSLAEGKGLTSSPWFVSEHSVSIRLNQMLF